MIREVLRTIYPRRCPGCGDVIAPDMLVCEICRDKFRRVAPPYCMRCGRHIENAEAEQCSECDRHGHHYIMGLAVLEYDALTKKAMSGLKFEGCGENAEFFADEAVKAAGARIKAFAPDALVPVPIHPSKRALRGYNQAELIAEGIGRALDIPVIEDFLVRSRKTSAQKKLGSESRRGNLKNAFSCDSLRYSAEEASHKFRRVLLVDDIYTTGTTMENCTQALLAAGVAEVGILSIAIGRNY